MRKAKTAVCAGFIVVAISVCSHCGPMGPEQTNTVQRKTDKASDSEDKLYYMDLSHPSVRQPIESNNKEVPSAKFVQVEVAEVVNPKKYALTFQVQYFPTSTSKIVLGSFSLYPADNPGKFIVATQGKLKNNGAIVVSMAVSEKVATNDQIRVGIKKLKFLKE